MVAGLLCPPNVYREWFSTQRNGRAIELPRIPDILMDGAAFLFPTRADAERRARSGGTAFLVSKTIDGSKETFGQELYIPYLVSCRHVVFSGGASVISINRRDGNAPDII